MTDSVEQITYKHKKWKLSSLALFYFHPITDARGPGAALARLSPRYYTAERQRIQQDNFQSWHVGLINLSRAVFIQMSFVTVWPYLIISRKPNEEVHRLATRIVRDPMYVPQEERLRCRADLTLSEFSKMKLHMTIRCLPPFTPSRAQKMFAFHRNFSPSSMEPHTFYVSFAPTVQTLCMEICEYINRYVDVLPFHSQAVLWTPSVYDCWWSEYSLQYHVHVQPSCQKQVCTANAFGGALYAHHLLHPFFLLVYHERNHINWRIC